MGFHPPLDLRHDHHNHQAANPTTVNVPLCLDLTLNWLLNVYDWSVDFHYDDDVNCDDCDN